ncbi:MAG: hypothetical protein Q8935_25525 [Bacillota bacterium]|nr:hypothetical protein [Bacillota bacterium]
MLKLFYCTATATDYDWVEIIVAESIEEAKEKFAKMVEDSNSWFSGESVDELTFEDYIVTVKKK